MDEDLCFMFMKALFRIEANDISRGCFFVMFRPIFTYSFICVCTYMGRILLCILLALSTYKNFMGFDIYTYPYAMTEGLRA